MANDLTSFNLIFKTLCRNALKVLTRGSLPFYNKAILCPKDERKYSSLDKLDFAQLPYPLRLTGTLFDGESSIVPSLIHFVIGDLNTEAGLRVALAAVRRMHG